MRSAPEIAIAIDDDTRFLTVVLRLLQSGRFKALGGPTLEGFRNLLSYTDFSVVPAHAMLTGESGLDAPAGFVDAHQSARMVFMSATDDTDKLAAASTSGVVGCLCKLFESQYLFDHLRQAMKATQDPHGKLYQSRSYQIKERQC